MAIDFHAVAQVSAEGMAECLVEGMLLAVIAAWGMWLAGVKDAATRFSVWMCALVTIAMLPFASAIWRSRGDVADAAVSSHPAAIHLPASWAIYAMAVWALVAGIGIVRIAVGLWQVYRLRSRCVEIEADTLQNLGVELGGVRVCVSDQVQAPVAVGFFRPAVIIPDWLMHELSSSQLRQVILHELTHLRRRDDWTNLAQKIVAAVLFFHPVVWWIERKLTLERELAGGGDARGYAECLVHLAEKSFMRRGLALAQAAVSRLRHTSLRIAQILDGRPRAARAWKPVTLSIAAVAVGFIGISLQAPTLISFQSSTPATTASLTQVAREDLAPVQKALVIPASAPVQDVKNARLLKPVAMVARPEPRLERAAAKITAGDPHTAGPRVQVVNARLADSNVNHRNAHIVSTETLVLLVSAPASGQVQVQMWRITVLRQASHPDYAPRKAI